MGFELFMDFVAKTHMWISHNRMIRMIIRDEYNIYLIYLKYVFYVPPMINFIIHLAVFQNKESFSKYGNHMHGSVDKCKC